MKEYDQRTPFSCLTRVRAVLHIFDQHAEEADVNGPSHPSDERVLLLQGMLLGPN